MIQSSPSQVAAKPASPASFGLQSVANSLFRRGMLTLVLTGLAATLLYLALYVWPFFLPREYSRLPLVDLGKITGYSTWGFWSFLIGMTVQIALYLLAWRTAARVDVPRAALVVFGLAVLMAATLVFMYPVNAIDVFDYVFHARIFTYYHENPLVVTPNDFAHDPLLEYVGWRDLPATYGPVWVYISAIPSLIGGSNLLVNLLAFKVLAVGLYLLNGLMIWWLLGQTTVKAGAPVRRPEMVRNSRLAGTLFFLWNPLVLWEVAGNGHNDVLMVMFGLLSVVCLIRGWRLLVLPAIILAALSKFVMIVLAPLLVLQVISELKTWRSRLVVVLISSLISLGFAVGLYLPLWQGVGSLGFLNRTDLFTGSLPAVVMAWLYKIDQDQLAVIIPRVIAFGGFGLFYLWQFVQFSRRRLPALFDSSQAWLAEPDAIESSRRDLLEVSFRVLFVYLAIASVWFMPWYLVWVIAFAALASVTAKRLAAIFSFTALLAYAIYVFIWVWNWDQIDLLGIYRLGVPFVFLPPVTLFIWYLAGHRSPADTAGAAPANPARLAARTESHRH